MKPFLSFIDIFSDLVSKFNVGFKSLLQQGLSEPEFYGDLVYKFRKIYACNDFSTQFRKIILQYKEIGYNIKLYDRLHAWLLTQSRLITLLPSLIARRRVRPQIL